MAGTTKKVLVPIANGSEEIEAVCIIDTLRRANAEVIVASVESDLQVTCTRKTNIVADCLIGDCKNQTFDLIALPGGMPGAERLSECKELIELLNKQRNENRYYAAVCAAPAVVFEKHNLLEGQKATCHPSFAEKIHDREQIDHRVVVSNKVVTSRGPGTSLEFSLKLVEVLYDRETAEKIQQAMLVPSF
jgi:4-methyl-5(b-hydroxyethyl)-thiazole monophosphate biosynthesis